MFLRMQPHVLQVDGIKLQLPTVENCISFLHFPVSLLHSLVSLLWDHHSHNLFAVESLTHSQLLWEDRPRQFQWMLLILLSDVLGLLLLILCPLPLVCFNFYVHICSIQGTSLGLLSILFGKCLNKLLAQDSLTVCF